MKSEWPNWLGISPHNDQMDCNAIESMFEANQNVQSIMGVPDAVDCAYEFEEIILHLLPVKTYSYVN